MSCKLLLLAAAAVLAGCGQSSHVFNRALELEAKSASIFSSVIRPRCVVCHNPRGQARFLDLSSAAVIFAARDREFAGGERLLDLANPPNSYLIKVIRDPVEPMPPRGSGVAELGERDVRSLEGWIGELARLTADE